MKIVLIVLLITILVICLIIPIFTDDTDKSFFKRSGAYLVTDYKTGLQYLAGPKGGITPRLDKDGNHMRIKE